MCTSQSICSGQFVQPLNQRNTSIKFVLIHATNEQFNIGVRVHAASHSVGLGLIWVPSKVASNLTNSQETSTHPVVLVKDFSEGTAYFLDLVPYLLYHQFNVDVAAQNPNHHGPSFSGHLFNRLAACLQL